MRFPPVFATPSPPEVRHGWRSICAPICRRRSWPAAWRTRSLDSPWQMCCARLPGLTPVAINLLREAGEVPREAERLAALIKAVPLLLTAPQPLARAISTAGGVALAEIDQQLMLRRLPGVFVAGEMLDWEAPTGGYLLQAVLATGRAAAHGVVSWLGSGGSGQCVPGKMASNQSSARVGQASGTS